MTGSSLALDRLHRWTEPCAFAASRARLMAYAGATDDREPLHVQGAAAPAAFHYVAALDAIGASMTSLAPDGLPGSALHAGHVITLHAPLLPDTVAMSRARTTSVIQRSTGTLLLTEVETHDVEGALLSEQVQSVFLVGYRSPDGFGQPHIEPAPPRTGPEQQLVSEMAVDQPWRYACPGGDHNSLHLDDSAARQAGLPGAIAHGACTLAMITARILAALGAAPEELRSVALRFASPAIPGRTLRTSLWGRNGHFGFETHSGGQPVLTRGSLTLRLPLGVPHAGSAEGIGEISASS